MAKQRDNAAKPTRQVSQESRQRKLQFNRCIALRRHFPMDFVRDASIFAALTGGLRQRLVPRYAAQLIHGVNRSVQGLHVLRKDTRIPCSLFPTPANADEPLVLSLPGELIMSRSLPTAGSRTRLRWLLATMVVASAGASGAFAQTPGCQVTYTAPTWVGGNGFGASIDIRNTGPDDQRLEPGIQLPEWSAHPERLAGHLHPARGKPDRHRFEQCSVERDASPRTGRSTSAFNGTFSGANNPPTSFTLNGTTCNGRRPAEHRADGFRDGADRRPGIPGRHDQREPRGERR